MSFFILFNLLLSFMVFLQPAVFRRLTDGDSVLQSRDTLMLSKQHHDTLRAVKLQHNPSKIPV